MASSLWILEADQLAGRRICLKQARGNTHLPDSKDEPEDCVRDWSSHCDQISLQKEGLLLSYSVRGVQPIIVGFLVGLSVAVMKQ